MVLVIGGMAQGKLDFARESLGVTSWSQGVLGEEDCVYGLQNALREVSQDAVLAWAEAHPQAVIICDEVGSGVVPIDPGDRAWRETVGRTCCALAKKADAVYRVTCGLGVRIK